MSWATFLVVYVSLPLLAADPKPRGWKPVMARLGHCIDKLPADAATVLRPALADLATGLNGGFLKAPRNTPPMPATYISSLERDAELCEFALARAKFGGIERVIADLRSDIEAKTADCREHGWYRNVRVQVETLRDGKAAPGWEIYYLWIPGRNLPSLQRVRFKALSPAEESLPPGLYSIQARKGDRSSEETRVAVVAKDSVQCQIPVP